MLKSPSFDILESIIKLLKSDILFSSFLLLLELNMLFSCELLLNLFLLLYIEKLLVFKSIKLSLYSDDFIDSFFSSFVILILSKHVILFMFIIMQDRYDINWDLYIFLTFGEFK